MDIQIMISLIGLFAVGIKLGFDIGRKKLVCTPSREQ